MEAQYQERLSKLLSPKCTTDFGLRCLGLCSYAFEFSGGWSRGTIFQGQCHNFTRHTRNFFAQSYKGKTLSNSYSNKVVDLLVKTNKKTPPSYTHAETCRFLQQAGQGKDSC